MILIATRFCKAANTIVRYKRFPIKFDTFVIFSPNLGVIKEIPDKRQCQTNDL